MEVYTLPNIGFLKDTLPVELFHSLKKESEILEYHNSPLTTGLTGPGVSKHYKMGTENKNLLTEYIHSLVGIFLKENPFYLNEYNVLKNDSILVFDDPWYNIQRKNEFLPVHSHDGVLSYSLWIKVPYDINAEKATTGVLNASTFQFFYTNILGRIKNITLEIDKSWEGKIILFPSKLNHCVYPFYSSDDKRISIAGNLSFNN